MEKLVVDILAEVVATVSTKMLATLQAINNTYEGVRYDYGHPSDIVAKLVSYSKTEANRYKKYPLIGFFLDFPQEKGNNAYQVTNNRLSGFIAVGTSNQYSPQERTEKSFKPLLYPIRDEFLKQLKRHPNIIVPEEGVFSFTQTDRYQWGKGGLEYYNNGEKNIFEDYIDAIEFSGLQVQVNPYC